MEKEADGGTSEPCPLAGGGPERLGAFWQVMGEKYGEKMRLCLFWVSAAFKPPRGNIPPQPGCDPVPGFGHPGGSPKTGEVAACRAW